MTSGITAIEASASQASANESTLSLGVRQAAATSLTSAASATSNTKTSSSREDTVQLSSSAQQYLQAASQVSAGATDSTLKNLVKAVAAGDNGALSLLLVI